MSQTACDPVVVGPGPNGLVGANALADAGWDVVLVEAQDEVGGAVMSSESVAPGFVTDLFSAFYPLAAGSPVIRDLHLEDHGLAWRQAPDVVAHAFPDGRCGVLRRSAADTRPASSTTTAAMATPGCGWSPAGTASATTCSPRSSRRSRRCGPECGCSATPGSAAPST